MSTSTKKLPIWHQACAMVCADPLATVTLEERADIVYRAACRVLGQLPKSLPDCLAINADYNAAQIALYKLHVIVKALNGDWQQDWNSYTQRKWAPWFYLNAPGFRFVVVYCDLTAASVSGGSRLALRTRERATFMGTHCITLYRDLMVGGDLAPSAFKIVD